MLKYLGISLLGLFVLLVFPVNVDSFVINVDQPKFYGAATVVAADQMGNEFFKQTVHNRLLDEGEHQMLGAVFSNGSAALADADAVGAICINDNDPTDAENMFAADFDNVLDTSRAAFGLTVGTGGNCRTDDRVDTETTDGIATIGGLVFTCSVSTETNCNPSERISSIAICNAQRADANYTNCATEGRIFAFVNLSNVTLTESETVTITYTFDISSANT